MERVPTKIAVFLALFMAASLLPSSLTAQITVGPNKKQLFMTGQLCKSHHDCKANTAYSTNFCINKISGSQVGHCAGVGPTLGGVASTTEDKKTKPKGGCGKCKTDADCRGCSVTAGCEKIILPGICA
ncbi:PREDICTED: uncharacterized protein LOC109151347 [Ipomoea nil]|uniref:uncharacterized protein LOC109151347 n=1 Tax=Ipomoea nil TaxID=35883 RepID=UPI000900CBB0|nr:PREDICTED: uncharacterized protein LOC109151347 [Ipomoea nil]